MAAVMAASKLLQWTSPASSSCFLWAVYRKASSAAAALAPSLTSRGPLLAEVPSRRIRLAGFPGARPAGAAAYSRFEQYTSSDAAADDADDGPAEAAAGVAWPEWGSFLEKLKGKGYFEGAVASGDGELGEGVDAAASAASCVDSMEFSRVKVACLSFARERFDLLRSLPREDIQTVVECGCPNTHRKPTNSGKRLRAYLMLNEKDVCSACKLRGSCDRANLILNEEEGARTVDVVRVILTYVTEPALLSRLDIPQREQVEGSIRRLLSELIELSDTVLDATLEKPTMNHPTKKEQHQKFVSMAQNVEMKRGDWICSRCNFLNFARNMRCLQCKADGPKRVDPDVEMKKGDWNCPQCQFMNFARNKRCVRCREPRPPRQLNPGEWECPSCDFLNFRRNRVCLRCNCERPSEELNGSAEQEWRKPRASTEELSSMF